MGRFATIQRKHALLVAVAFAAAIPYGCHAAWSLGAGAGIQVANLWALEWSVRLIVGLRGAGARARGHLLLVVRFVLLLGVVALVMTQTTVEPVPFTLGLMLAVPAAAWQGLAEARRAGR